MSKSRARTGAPLAGEEETKSLGISSLSMRSQEPCELGGGRTLLPPGSFSNPQMLVCKQGLQGIHQLLPLYPAHLPSSPQSSFSAAPEHPWAPPVPWKVRALSEFHHMQMQSPYLGLGADTSPLPGREPGQGRPRGALRAVPGSGSSVPHAGNTPHLGCTCMCHA